MSTSGCPPCFREKEGTNRALSRPIPRNLRRFPQRWQNPEFAKSCFKRPPPAGGNRREPSRKPRLVQRQTALRPLEPNPLYRLFRESQPPPVPFTPGRFFPFALAAGFRFPVILHKGFPPFSEISEKNFAGFRIPPLFIFPLNVTLKITPPGAFEKWRNAREAFLRGREAAVGRLAISQTGPRASKL